MRVDFTIINRLKDPVTILFIAIHVCCCFKLFRFWEFRGSSCWRFWKSDFLCSDSEGYPRRIL